MDDVNALTRERDLLERLLDLGEVAEPEAFLAEALAVAIERTGALRGYLGLLHGEAATPRWWTARDCEAKVVDELHVAMSRGIVGSALATGTTLRITNALLDADWSSRQSVRRQHIEAVVCVPIGHGPPVGVLYLQGRPGGGAFPPDAVAGAERLARWLAPLCRRLLSSLDEDPTSSLRARLKVEELVGRSPAMARLLAQVELAAAYDLDVLLFGPTGAGKTAVAAAIARLGGRSDRPFIVCNCGALAPSMLEAELFGAAPGSFTGAGRDGITGLVAAAEGGVLLLDEIGELTPSAQAALLAFLDDQKRYRRVGDSQTRTADVRVIAATNRDLDAEVKAGRFRADLFHRLSNLVVRVPGLDERREDIPRIAEALMADRARRHQVPARDLTPAAARALAEAEWSGHIRQLGKVVEVAMLRAHLEGASRIEVAHLFPARGAGEEPAETWQAATRRFQTTLLKDTLEATGWNVGEAAKRLDVARSHVYSLITAFGLGK